MNTSDSEHISVLADEVLHWLQPCAGQVLVDGTLGGGGHTRLLASAVIPNGQVITLDRDLASIERGRQSLAELPVICVHSNFCDLAEVLENQGVQPVHGILLDLGISSDQLADDSRGFSFNASGPLDMRFNAEEGESVAELINRVREKQLADLIYEYGEERRSRRIARKIIEERKQTPIRDSAHLARIVRSCFPRPASGRIDSATRTFQALRIAVNGELEALDEALKVFPDLLAKGGRLAIISFHSLEDRRVKYAFRDDTRLKVLTRKPVVAGELERMRNARSRSAKLRVAERV